MRRLLILFIINLFYLNCLSQERFTISGYVQEDKSGENLIGVSIYDKSSKKGTTSNQYGFYSITLDKGDYEIVYSFIGLKTITEEIILDRDLRLNISLSEKSILTDEVIISAEKQDKNIESTDMGQAKLKVENI